MSPATELALSDLIARITVAMENFENVEHRVANVIEGNRTQLSHLAHTLKIREIRGEFRDMINAMTSLAGAIADANRIEAMKLAAAIPLPSSSPP